MASTGTSLVVSGLLIAAIAYAGARVVARRAPEEVIDVSFRDPGFDDAPEPAKPEEPPPPPPPAVKRSAPRPGRVLAEPTAVPEARPAEAAPTGEAAVEGDPDEFGDGGGAAPAPTRPAPPPPPAAPVEVARPAPIDVPDEDVSPARPLPGNAAPSYPEDARKQGREGIVILKIRISAAGEVIHVDVLRGEEPFVGAAVATVKGWRYRPALVEGAPAEASRIVRIPFRLKS